MFQSWRQLFLKTEHTIILVCYKMFNVVTYNLMVEMIININHTKHNHYTRVLLRSRLNFDIWFRSIVNSRSLYQLCFAFTCIPTSTKFNWLVFGIIYIEHSPQYNETHYHHKKIVFSIYLADGLRSTIYIGTPPWETVRELACGNK